MMQWKRTQLMLVALALTCPHAAQAQLEPNDVAVMFDLDGTQFCRDIVGFTVQVFYVLAYQVSDYSGWEASVTMSDPSWSILSTTLHPPSALNVGAVGNFIVGLGDCVGGTSGFMPLVTYTLGYFAGPIAPSDVVICLGPAAPSSFGSSPGYATCTDELVNLRPVPMGQGVYPDGCSVINNTQWCPVGTSTTSFGGLKARY